MKRKPESASESETDSDESEYIVSDSEEPLTEAERMEVQKEMGFYRDARADIMVMAGDYLRGLQQPRVHERVLAKAYGAAGKALDKVFMDFLRSDADLNLADLEHGTRGTCAACSKPRWLSKKVGNRHVGRICATRAIVFHTLHHVQRSCTTALEDSVLADVRFLQASAVSAFQSLLEAADLTADLCESNGCDADALYDDVMLLRPQLGFAV